MEAMCPTGCWWVAQPSSISRVSHHMMPKHYSQLPGKPPSTQVYKSTSQPTNGNQRSTTHQPHCTMCTELDSSLSGWYIAYFHLRAVASAGVTRAHTRKPSGHISSPKSPAWGQICQNSEISLSCINWLIKITFIGSKLICPLLQN